MPHKHDILRAQWLSSKGLRKDIEEALGEGFEVGFVYLIKKRTGKEKYDLVTRFLKEPQWPDELLAELLTADIEHLKKRKG